MSPQQVFDWRRQARKALAEAGAPAEPSFVPVVAEAPVLVPDAAPATARPAPSIELELAGAVLRVAPGTDAALLTSVLRAIRTSAT